MVVCADRDAAGRHRHVSAERISQDRDRLRVVVPDGAHRRHRCAGGRHLCGQRVAVRIPDRSVRERHAGVDQLVARDDDRHPWAAGACDASAPVDAATPSSAGPIRSPPARRPLPRGCPRPHAAPRRPARAGGSRSGAVFLERVLHAQDHVAAGRQLRAGRDPHRLACSRRAPYGAPARDSPASPGAARARRRRRSPCRPRAGRTRPWPSCRSRARRLGWPRPREHAPSASLSGPLRGSAHGALEHALARLGGGQRRMNEPGGHGRGYTARADAAGTSRRAARARPRRARAA